MAIPNGWRVVDQDHREKYTGRGTFEPVVTVYYETASGTKGSVDFPEATYTPEAVTTRLNELVGRIHAVADLNGI